MVQEKITKIVADYKKLYPDEYRLVAAEVQEKKRSQFNEFGARVTDTGKIDFNANLERALLELPTTLYWMILDVLSEAEAKEFRTKQTMRWIAKKFPEFCVVEKV